jgi:hypothetical protein
MVLLLIQSLKTSWLTRALNMMVRMKIKGGAVAGPAAAQAGAAGRRDVARRMTLMPSWMRMMKWVTSLWMKEMRVQEGGGREGWQELLD